VVCARVVGVTCPEENLAEAVERVGFRVRITVLASYGQGPFARHSSTASNTRGRVAETVPGSPESLAFTCNGPNTANRIRLPD
jgi:hypothetical protein